MSNSKFINSNTNDNFNILSPKIDIIFQALFGEIGSENITRRFLENILEEKIDSVDLSKNTIVRKRYLTDKLGILDVLAKINGKELCNIEMQIASSNTIVERILYYWAKLYSKQIINGDKYDKLERTICILISDKCIKGLNTLPYKTSWKIIEEKYRKTILTNKLTIYIIELEKITKLSKDNSELLDWLFFLENPKCERVIEKMKGNKELREANEKLEEILSDEDMQRIADLKLKAILDENTAKGEAFDDGLKQGIKEGIEQGLAQGIEQGLAQGIKQGITQGVAQGINQGIEQGIIQGVEQNKKEIAVNMLKSGYSNNDISKITKLPLDQIKKLKMI